MSNDPLDIAEAAKRKNLVKYHETLGEEFKSKESPKAARRYHLIARIPFLSRATLNFDPLLMEIMDLHKNIKVSAYPSLRIQDLGKDEVFYLHGRVDPKHPPDHRPIVLTRSDFEEAYDPNNSRLHAFLLSLFQDYDTCFIGCDPSQPNLQRILETCERSCEWNHGGTDARRPRHFMLCERESDLPGKVTSSGIHPVAFDRADDMFRGLDEVLEYLARKRKPEIRRPGVDRSPFLPETEPDR